MANQWVGALVGRGLDSLLHLLASPPGPPSALLMPSHLVGAERCQKPQWDSRFIFDQEWGTFNPNDVVKLRCPEGYWPPPMEIKCVKLNTREGSMIPRSGWFVRNSTGRWHRMEGNLTCVDILQVVPGTLEISSTSIKLNWTCRLPDACQHIWARCRLEERSSPPCEAEEVKGEEMLHGQEGTFTCPPLQPFTVYSVTVSLPPSTILYTRLLRTKETVPDKPEKLWLDPNTGSLRWKALPSCKGEIIGYQLNITTRRAHDGSFLEFKQVLVNQSVTQYTPLHQTPGSKYMVTVQGLTVAGAGAASLLEFQTYVSGNGCSALGLAVVASLGANAEPGAASGAVCVPTLKTVPPCLSLQQPGQQSLDTHVYTHVHTQRQGWGCCWHMVQSVAPTPGCVLVSGQSLGLWPGSAVTVVVLVLVLVPLSAGILWFVLSR
uniref:Fibronectin type-III domain-containing protein n=1 Tax=Bubo bubo TaxID=30461 RepID=A0A8C0FJ27_BUBBB